ncbi:MAG TPA: sigma-70 family RNA polymerase sigma factor [Solirubrobacterales bacterium]|nr:sigma-70 family RNA polymerase sigma factor [Solirubrobacterales bacterium]
MKGRSRIARAKAELAAICRREARSGWPAWDRWQNEDVWHETFLRLAQRIDDGRVTIDQPLRPLARKTAFRLFLREGERQRRFFQLSESQLHRFRQSEELLPEDYAEVSRRAVLLRETLLRLCAEEKLDERDVLVLTLRYVEGWPAAAVAERLEIGAAGVRKICSRRLQLLRREMVDSEMTDATEAPV